MEIIRTRRTGEHDIQVQPVVILPSCCIKPWNRPLFLTTVNDDAFLHIAALACCRGNDTAVPNGEARSHHLMVPEIEGLGVARLDENQRSCVLAGQAVAMETQPRAKSGSSEFVHV